MIDYIERAVTILYTYGIVAGALWITVVTPVSTLLYHIKMRKHFLAMKLMGDDNNLLRDYIMQQHVPYIVSLTEFDANVHTYNRVVFDPWVSIWYIDRGPGFFSVITKTTTLVHAWRCVFLGTLFFCLPAFIVILSGIYLYQERKQRQQNINEAITALGG